MTSNTQHAESGSSIGRRTFIKGVGAAGAAGVGLSGRAPGGLSPVGSADALPPLVIGGVAGAAVVGRFLRDADIILADSAPEGLTAPALRQSVYQTARTRKSTNASTIVDNQNLADGMRQTAYTDGKIAAIEKLNEEASLEDVQNAADTVAKDYFTTVKRNLLETYNESAKEFENLMLGLDSHPDADSTDVFTGHLVDNDPDYDLYFDNQTIEVVQSSETLPDGSVLDYTAVQVIEDNISWFANDSGSSGDQYDVVKSTDPTTEIKDGARGGDVSIRVTHDGNGFNFFEKVDWRPIWTQIEDVQSEVIGGLQNWTASVYDEVQSGSIDVSDLLTPREQAELLADDEEYPQAVADLIALNIPVDPDREATISFTERDITISGLMAPTSPPADGFVVGQTYDPAAEPWDLYFTYDPSRGSGGWSEYEVRISEGELRFTDEPMADVLFRVPTNVGTVEVVSSDFTETDSGGVWTADVSEQVERTTEEWTDYEPGIDGGTVTFTALPDESADFDIVANDGGEETVSASQFTEIDSTTFEVETDLGISEVESVAAHINRADITEAVSIYSEDGSAEYETVQISDEFTLEKLEDSEGNTYGEAEFSQSEPQDDTNYITQEEWDELEQQNQELIDKYEEAASGDDSLFGGGGFDFGEFGEIPAGATAAAAGVAVVVVIVGVLRQVASFYLPGR